MSGYAPEPGGDGFAGSRVGFAEIEGWLAGPEAAGLGHAELEEQLDARGRELLRRLYQDHLDLRAVREQRRQQVTGADGVSRTRAEKDHSRPLATIFGQVTVTRIGYRAPGVPNVYPADEQLSLPAEKRSMGLRELAAIEAAGGSFGDAAAAVSRATGVPASGSWSSSPAAPPPISRGFTPTAAGRRRRPRPARCWWWRPTARASGCARARCGQPLPATRPKPCPDSRGGCRAARSAPASGWPRWGRCSI